MPKHNSALPLHDPENPGDECRFFVQDVVGREYIIYIYIRIRKVIEIQLQYNFQNDSKMGEQY